MTSNEQGSRDHLIIPVLVAGAVIAATLIVRRIAGGGDKVPVASESPTEKSPPSTKSKYVAADPTADMPFARVFKEQEATLMFSQSGIASKDEYPPITVTELLRKAVEKRGAKVALRVERHLERNPKTPEPSAPLAQWTTWTWAQYYADVMMTAKAFMALGVKSFSAVTVFGFNSPEWFMSQLACIAAGGICAGIYPSDNAEQVKFKARHSGAVIAVVDTEDKAKVFLSLAADLPELRAVVVWGSEGKKIDVREGNIRYCSWEVLAELAQTVTDEDLAERIASQQPGNVCSLIYTSGTTGNPKAVMITHDNIVFESRNVGYIIQDVLRGEEEQRILSYLPLSHVAGLMVDIVCPAVFSAEHPSWVSVAFARPYDLKLGTLADRLRVVRPTIFIGVPRVWEKIAEKMKAMVLANPLTGMKLKVAQWSKNKGLAHARNCQLGGSGYKPFGYRIAEKKVLNVVKQRLGLDCCKFAFTGAAPMGVDTLEYFGSLGIQINEVYGMSECTGATTWSTDRAHVWGSCGWAMPGTEVKIFRPNENKEQKGFQECPRARDLMHPTDLEQGEICFRGRHIMMGYLANPDLGEQHVKEINAKTREAIDQDGWLHSGDKGCADSRGMYRITGRYKELIIGAGGENIAPVPMEDSIKKLCGAVSNVIMLGDKRKFNIALITLKAKGATGELPGGDELDGEARALVPGVTTISAASASKEFVEKIQVAITKTNKDGSACPSSAAAIQKFTILPCDFSVSTNELTATLKLKRSVVAEKYQAVIDKVYDDAQNAYVPIIVAQQS